MDYSQIIHDAWRLTTGTSKLKWLCFFPSFAAVVFFVVEIIWQGGLLSEELGILEHSFVYSKIGEILSFITQNHLLGWAIFVIIFVLLFQFVFPSWISSSLILGIRRRYDHPDKYLSGRQIILDGFQYFPKLVELHAIFSPFAFLSIAFFSVTLYRYYHGDIFSNILCPILIVFSIFALIVNIFTIFCPFFIVLEDAPVMTSIKKSVGLVFVNLEATMTVIMIMILVSFRIIMNVVVVVGVPIGLFFAVSYFAQTGWFAFALSVVGLVSIVLLGLSAYLTAIVDVLSNAIWIRVFDCLRTKQEADRAALENREASADISDSDPQ